MSKSLKRVRAALEAAGIDAQILEIADGARTAAEAAFAARCDIDQILKSVIFRGEADGHVVLFMTAGGQKVDPGKASAAAGAPLGKADAKLIRAETGFAIGGVSPIGHIAPVRAFMDPRLLDFDLVWAAAGTPRHIFAADPRQIAKISSAQVTEFTS